MEKVIVIGAGLGGLALAHGLTGAGFDVTVYERDSGPDSRAQGYRISLNEMGTAALAALLPTARFARLSDVDVRGVGEDFTFATARMRPLLRFDGGAGARTVRRAALRRHLAEGLNVVWGRRLVGLRDDGHGDGHGVEVRFADGGTARADLAVGADGAGSDVRAAMRGDAVPATLSLGITSIGGHVDRSAGWDALLPLNRAGAVQYFGPRGLSLFVSFCEREDRTPTVLWALSSRRSLETGEAGAAMAHAAWHPHLRRLVTGTAPDDLVQPLALTTTRIPKRLPAPLWPSGRVTLLGDAAHVMPPQRGLGGNSAFADARGLVDALRRPGALVDRIAAYEREMFDRGRRAVEESEEAAQMFHFRNPVAVAARSVLLRAAGAGSTLRNRHRGAVSGARVEPPVRPA